MIDSPTARPTARVVRGHVADLPALAGAERGLRAAAADGRADFLACSSAEARVRLDQFLADGVIPVAGGRSWKIGVLSED